MNEMKHGRGGDANVGQSMVQVNLIIALTRAKSWKLAEKEVNTGAKLRHKNVSPALPVSIESGAVENVSCPSRPKWKEPSC